MVKFWYYAQVGIYVALAGLVLGSMLNNSIWGNNGSNRLKRY